MKKKPTPELTARVHRLEGQMRLLVDLNTEQISAMERIRKRLDALEAGPRGNRPAPE